MAFSPQSVTLSTSKLRTESFCNQTDHQSLVSGLVSDSEGGQHGGLGNVELLMCECVLEKVLLVCF